MLKIKFDIGTTDFSETFKVSFVCRLHFKSDADKGIERQIDKTKILESQNQIQKFILIILNLIW